MADTTTEDETTTVAHSALTGQNLHAEYSYSYSRIFEMLVDTSFTSDDVGRLVYVGYGGGYYGGYFRITEVLDSGLASFQPLADSCYRLGSGYSNFPYSLNTKSQVDSESVQFYQRNFVPRFLPSLDPIKNSSSGIPGQELSSPIDCVKFNLTLSTQNDQGSLAFDAILLPSDFLVVNGYLLGFAPIESLLDATVRLAIVDGADNLGDVGAKLQPVLLPAQPETYSGTSDTLGDFTVYGISLKKEVAALSYDPILVDSVEVDLDTPYGYTNWYWNFGVAALLLKSSLNDVPDSVGTTISGAIQFVFYLKNPKYYDEDSGEFVAFTADDTDTVSALNDDLVVLANLEEFFDDTMTFGYQTDITINQILVVEDAVRSIDSETSTMMRILVTLSITGVDFKGES